MDEPSGIARGPHAPALPRANAGPRTAAEPGRGDIAVADPGPCRRRPLPPFPRGGLRRTRRGPADERGAARRVPGREPVQHALPGETLQGAPHRDVGLAPPNRRGGAAVPPGSLRPRARRGDDRAPAGLLPGHPRRVGALPRDRPGRELPLVTPAGSPDELGLRATDVSESRFLASRQRPVSAGSFLRAIRDAQAVDRVYAPAHLTVRPAEEVGRLVNVRAAGPAVERREVLPGGRLGDRQAPRGARASPPRCTRAGPRAGAGWGAGGEGRTRR